MSDDSDDDFGGRAVERGARAAGGFLDTLAWFFVAACVVLVALVVIAVIS